MHENLQRTSTCFHGLQEHALPYICILLPSNPQPLPACFLYFVLVSWKYPVTVVTRHDVHHVIYKLVLFSCIWFVGPGGGAIVVATPVSRSFHNILLAFPGITFVIIHYCTLLQFIVVQIVFCLFRIYALFVCCILCHIGNRSCLIRSTPCQIVIWHSVMNNF
jgi:hypothetical protein